MLRHTLSQVLAFALLAPTARADEDILIADFEGTDYGDWKTTGEAFGRGPARGTLPGQMPVSGYKGKGLVNSFYKGDRTTGTLTSPEFTIQRKYITFLIGGGKDPEKLAMNLLVGGKVVRTATGVNDKPGGSEALEPAAWGGGELAGKAATIQIGGHPTGGRGRNTGDHTPHRPRQAPRPP